MSERNQADRFSRELDEILSGRKTGPTDAEECDKRAIARMLADADFSGESRIRQALRNRLLHGIDARELKRIRRQNQKEAVMKAFQTYVWRPLPAVTALAVLFAVVALPLIWPGTLPAAAMNLDSYVRSLVVGEHTTVKQAPMQPQGTPPPSTTNVRMWLVQTPIAAFGGNVPEGADPTVRYYPSFDLAQESVSSTEFKQPEYLPPGYLLVEALVTPSEALLLRYASFTAGDIVLVQNPVGTKSVPVTRSPQGITSKSVVTGITMSTDAPIRAITLNGKPAAWIEEDMGQNSLTWEADGMSYILGGIRLSLDEAVKIAQSLC
ncbi:MAG TPA: DUF4367 domain-containing protein [Armatimonadota bacterium]|nr:DUF4367 domain-containing protein [Armatimonadota bacterium]HUT02772.1 DUF4367 domain-containing protein [bacterium]